MQPWFDGIDLIGRYGPLDTGVWLLSHDGEAALLELPPVPWAEDSPARDALAAAAARGVRVKYLLCTHAHFDHYSRRTHSQMRHAFPDAVTILQAGFREHAENGTPSDALRLRDELTLDLGGEPLHLLHAPKHSPTDTFVIFRGSACTGDWELNTLRSVHDEHAPVPRAKKLESIARAIDYVRRRDYRVHRTYSVHANDRRENVDFEALLADTRTDRKLW